MSAYDFYSVATQTYYLPFSTSDTLTLIYSRLVAS